jgi:hypothetical protein
MKQLSLSGGAIDDGTMHKMRGTVQRDNPGLREKSNLLKVPEEVTVAKKPIGCPHYCDRIEMIEEQRARRYMLSMIQCWRCFDQWFDAMTEDVPCRSPA